MFTAGRLYMITDHLPKTATVALLTKLLHVDELLVEAQIEVVVFIEDVRDAPAHAGSDVLAGRSQDDDTAPGHIFQGMIATAFHDCDRTGVAHRKALPGNAVDIGAAAGGAIERDIADDDVLFRRICRSCRRCHAQLAAGETFAKIIIGIALQMDGNTCRQKGTERLTAAAAANDLTSIFGQRRAMMPGDIRS